MTDKPEEPQHPLLSNYFNFNDDAVNKSNQNTEFLSNFSLDKEAKCNINLKQPEQNEIEQEQEKPPLNVCRLFAETTIPIRDPAAAFFDTIGNEMENKNELDMEEENIVECTNTNLYPRDIWIPSESTRQAFLALKNGCFEANMMTMPGILLEDELGDAIGETVKTYLGEAESMQRRYLGADDVTQDERGLRELVQAGAYRAAINLTARLLSIYGQGKGRIGHPTKHSPHSLQLWFTRIALLLKTKAFNIAEMEAQPFGQLDKPDVFYQFYPEMYNGRTGSIASFSFRLLLAELPLQCGRAKESLTKLFNLLAVIKKILHSFSETNDNNGSTTTSSQTDSINLWKGREVRVIHSIINAAILNQDYQLAEELLTQLCYKDPAVSNSSLLSSLGRLYLQLGNIPGAEKCFKASANTNNVRHIVDESLLAIARNDYKEAYIRLQQANKLEPSNVMVLNNIAVCLLYDGRIKDAIATIESALLTADPVQVLHESLIVNLCFMYDIGSCDGKEKKLALLKQLAKYRADISTSILEKLCT